MISFGVDRYRNRNQNLLVAEHVKHETAENDSKYALTMIGDDSVYQFFLGKSWVGWTIFLATIWAQFWILLLFVDAAEINLSNDNTDLVYTWKCPRDQDECRDTADLSPKGWLAFSILMVAHLLKDIVNGTKMVVLSGKERHGHHSRIRYFVGGTLLGAVAMFTFYVSIIYNVAIATSNTEIIVNSVVILFICDIDELLYDILVSANSDWVDSMCYQVQEESVAPVSEKNKSPDDDSIREEQNAEGNRDVEGLWHVVHILDKEVQTLRQNMDMLVEENTKLRRLSTPRGRGPQGGNTGNEGSLETPRTAARTIGIQRKATAASSTGPQKKAPPRQHSGTGVPPPKKERKTIPYSFSSKSYEVPTHRKGGRRVSDSYSSESSDSSSSSSSDSSSQSHC
mmetsp:Transcript_34074/g.62668  ORF Transcript_34074/g.62668 Transcript_34074/m.62668 type:complete len:397 (-) Transcript_34074:283-1473(-)